MKHDLLKFNSVFTHSQSAATRIICDLKASKRKVINEKSIIKIYDCWWILTGESRQGTFNSLYIKA